MNSIFTTYRKLFLLFFILLFLLPAKQTEAKKNVKVATIGAVSPQYTNNMQPQIMVDGMIRFWKKELAQVLPDNPDLIVLPEHCDRPRGLNSETISAYYAVRKNQLQEFFSSVAKENSCYIAFGAKRQVEDDSWRNSIIILDRNGDVKGIYNKNFPTIEEMEGGVKAGKDTPVFELDFGTVGCAICFDLNFEELLRKYQQLQPNILLFSSMYHGGMVQPYWAYSCRSFFVGAIGSRKSPSEIRNPLGDVVATTTNYFDFVVTTINVDSRLVHLDYNWAKLRALKAKYGEKVIVYDPGEVGAVLVTSEDENKTVVEMLNEFEIELLDDYLKRSADFCNKSGYRE